MNIVVKMTKLNGETGELISNRSWVEAPNDIIPFRRKSRFSKAFHSDVAYFPKDSYYKCWYLLARCLEQNTNRLVKITRQVDHWLEAVPMNVNDIIKLLKIGKSSFYNFMSYCKDHHYIHEVKVNDEQAFYMNPVYELNGSGITVELYLIFKGTCIERYVSKESKAMIKDYLGLDSINEPETIS